MSQLYPLLMSPLFDPRPWGTIDLATIYPNRKFAEKIGEAWLTGDNCKVTNGPLANRTLSQLSTQFGAELVGTAAPDGQYRGHRYTLPDSSVVENSCRFRNANRSTIKYGAASNAWADGSTVLAPNSVTSVTTA